MVRLGSSLACCGAPTARRRWREAGGVVTRLRSAPAEARKRTPLELERDRRELEQAVAAWPKARKPTPERSHDHGALIPYGDTASSALISANLPRVALIAALCSTAMLISWAKEGLPTPDEDASGSGRCDARRRGSGARFRSYEPGATTRAPSGCSLWAAASWRSELPSMPSISSG